MSNFYDKYDWQYMLTAHPAKGDERERQDEIKARYFKILSPEFPKWIKPYLELPLMQRLKGVGLLCGTDWTRLYRNRFYYSRYDHSLGVALIVWHFTHDKAQALAGLLHDISTPVFSHVADFRKGDALKQEATEEDNAAIVKRDAALAALLKADGLTAEQVADYHQYPVADNEIPQLSADRLEYMFPSGLALDGSWTFEEIERVYNDLAVLENEDGQPELGFRTIAAAEEYTLHFCLIGHILQLNENKLCLQLLAEVVKEAIALGLLTEEDTMRLSEAEVMARFDEAALRFATDAFKADCSEDKAVSADKAGGAQAFKADEPENKALSADKAAAPHAARFSQLYRTYRTMEHIEHVDSPLPDAFNISMKVKQRYINPLVQPEGTGKAVRIASVSDKAALYVNDFLLYEDTLYGAVPFTSESRMHNKADDSFKAGGRTVIALIAAVARNGVIGADGRIPWDIPEDRKHFKELTMGHVLVMGRRTFEEIGRPLPGRITIVVSKTLAAECGGARALKADDCLLYAASLDDAICFAGEVAPEKTVFIAGGGMLYKAALPLVDVLYLTEIDAEISGDTYFPAAAFAQRSEFIESEVTGSGVSESGLVYRYVTYRRLPWSACCEHVESFLQNEQAAAQLLNLLHTAYDL